MVTIQRINDLTTYKNDLNVNHTAHGRYEINFRLIKFYGFFYRLFMESFKNLCSYTD